MTLRALSLLHSIPSTALPSPPAVAGPSAKSGSDSTRPAGPRGLADIQRGKRVHGAALPVIVLGRTDHDGCVPRIAVAIATSGRKARPARGGCASAAKLPTGSVPRSPLVGVLPAATGHRHRGPVTDADDQCQPGLYNASAGL